MGDTMIESLYIENFAIIDQVQIDFQSGMTVLTGETGAGKSIIIDAIGQLIGQRSQPSFVKNGADYALNVFFLLKKKYIKFYWLIIFPLMFILLFQKKLIAMVNQQSKLIIVILVNYY